MATDALVTGTAAQIAGTVWTTTEGFRDDLAAFFGSLAPTGRDARLDASLTPVSPLTILELGVHEGRTTAWLAAIFRRVIAVDVDPGLLKKAAARQMMFVNAPNVVFIMMDLYGDSWSTLRLNQIEVVMIDALHTYSAVKSDTIQSLQVQTVQWLVYHDYGLGRWPSATKRVVDEFVQAGFLDCGPGSPPPRARPLSNTTREPARGGVIGMPQLSGPEGVICKVLRPWTWSASGTQPIIENFVLQWLFYEQAEEQSILNKPFAVCSVAGFDVTCTGGIWGTGVVSYPEEDRRSQLWRFHARGTARNRQLAMRCSSDMKSFRSTYRSGEGTWFLLGVSSASPWAAFNTHYQAWEVDHLHQPSGVVAPTCCRAARIMQKSNVSCSLAARVFAEYPPICSSQRLATCDSIWTCEAAGQQAFRLEFDAQRWFLALQRHGAPSAGPEFTIEGGQGSVPSTWHATVCAACKQLLGLDRDGLVWQAIRVWASAYGPATGPLENLLENPAYSPAQFASMTLVKMGG